ncbi:MAG: hypothetical protein IK034_02770, partial [Bacilli bacterium]|nr:hypothetical protein [Bacilli bacterium]
GEPVPVETVSEEVLTDGPTFTVPLEQYHADKEQLVALQKENESQARRIAELEERLAEEEKNKARLAEVEKEKRSEEERGKTVTIIAPSKKIEKITPTVVRVRRDYSKYALDIGGIKTDPFGHITFVGNPHAEQNKAASQKFIKVKKDAKEEKPESKEKVFRIKKAK